MRIQAYVTDIKVSEKKTTLNVEFNQEIPAAEIEKIVGMIKSGRVAELELYYPNELIVA